MISMFAKAGVRSERRKVSFHSPAAMNCSWNEYMKPGAPRRQLTRGCDVLFLPPRPPPVALADFAREKPHERCCGESRSCYGLGFVLSKSAFIRASFFFYVVVVLLLLLLFSTRLSTRLRRPISVCRNLMCSATEMTPTHKQKFKKSTTAATPSTQPNPPPQDPLLQK